MPSQSLYYLECETCRGLYTTPTKTGICPHCGMSYKLIWPDNGEQKESEQKESQNDPSSSSQ